MVGALNIDVPRGGAWLRLRPVVGPLGDLGDFGMSFATRLKGTVTPLEVHGQLVLVMMASYSTRGGFLENPVALH